MIEVIGKVKAIDLENNNGHDKKVLQLSCFDNETMFIEFQGRMMKKLWDIDTGQNVSVKIKFNGKISSLGHKYNNLLGKSIKTL